jgi:LytR cell envelope-related transcriptional attenuator
MLLFALSFQEQVEKYGVYVGIAAFFGLAVMSLLYFSQARELKRIREWAERAPERATELERRVVAQATVARRAAPVPGKPGIAPPRRLAEMPAPATAAAAPQATEVAEAVEADPVTNGNVPKPPFGPGGTVPAGPLPANGVAPAASPNGAAAAEAEGDDVSGDGQPAPAEAAVARAGQGAEAGDHAAADETAVARAGQVAPGAETGEQTAPDETEVARGGQGAEAGDQAAADAPAVARAGQPTPGDRGAADETAARGGTRDAAPPGATEPAGFPALDDDTGTAPGEIPPATAVPRATPSQQRAPAPMPLRQSQPSATPRGGGRRPGAPAGRRPAAKPPRDGRSAGTIALFVGLAVLILGGGAFLGSQLLGGDEQPTPPNRAAPPPTETADAGSGGGGGGGGGAQAAPKGETNVAVLNGTTFPGLAGQLADEVAADGYERGVTETNIRDQTIEESVVYYADGFRPSARAVGKLFSISQLEPLDSETASLAPGADVVVLAGADQTP